MRDLLQKIQALFKVAKLISSDDSGAFTQGIFSYMGSTPKGQIFMPYGIMANPPPGAQVMVFSQNGHESNAIGLAGDPNNRTLKDLEIGEFAVGNFLTGSYLLFKANGDAVIVTESGQTVINGIVFETHVHEQGNDSGGSTEQDTENPKNP